MIVPITSVQETSSDIAIEIPSCILRLWEACSTLRDTLPGEHAQAQFGSIAFDDRHRWG